LKLPTTIKIKKYRSKTKSPLLEKLIALNIPQNRAEKLIKDHGKDNYLEDWIEAVNGQELANPAGFLITALKERWELPKHIRKKRAQRIKDQNEKLRVQYYETIFKQVDAWRGENMANDQWTREIEQHREVFLNKYPAYKEFQNSVFLNQYIEEDYKKIKAEELGLPTFEEYKIMER